MIFIGFKSINARKLKISMLAVLILLVLSPIVSAPGPDPPAIFQGFAYLDNTLVPVGTSITVEIELDDGTRLEIGNTVTVITPGYFSGLQAVGDNPDTINVKDGAEQNDLLIFKVNGIEANTTPSNILWKSGNYEDIIYLYAFWPQCDTNHDGIIIHDLNDLMYGYKCFLRIEKNCNKIDYQDWQDMKKEYQCFVDSQ